MYFEGFYDNGTNQRSGILRQATDKTDEVTRSNERGVARQVSTYGATGKLAFLFLIGSDMATVLIGIDRGCEVVVGGKREG